MSALPEPVAGQTVERERLCRAVANAVACSPAEVEVKETHISVLFLAPERVFKLKKPITLEFVDYGTPERRRLMCNEEVRLNRRLAPSVYLGVRALVEIDDELQITDESDPAAIDYVVEMRRYDEQATLEAHARGGQIDGDELVAVGRLLAEFHARCRRRRLEDGAGAVRATVEQNLRELYAELADGDTETHTRLLAIARCLQHILVAQRRLLARRARSGAVRGGHGDLRAEHVVLEPRLEIVDCVEFSHSLRTIDTADDLAFLVMDLCAHGQEPAARQLLSAYRAAGGDCGPDALVWFYAVHRALVRAKVALIRQGQTDTAGDGRLSQPAASLLAAAERCAWRARGAGVVVLCGVSASGKSHLARALGAAAGVPVLSTDVVRKQQAGLEPQQRAPISLYRSQVSLETYRELGARAARLAGDGIRPLVDGTFRRRADRDAFRDGFDDAAPLCFVQCIAPDAVLAERAAARERDSTRVSDATAEVAGRQRHSFEPLDEVSADAHILLRTDRPAEATLADLATLLDRRLLAC